MLSKKELLKSPEYWVEEIQNQLFNEVQAYMQANNLNRIKLAEEWGVSKGYITQILSGQCNFSLKKLVELSLKMQKAPVIQYAKTDDIYEMNKLSSMVNEQFQKPTFVAPTGKIIALKNNFSISTSIIKNQKQTNISAA